MFLEGIGSILQNTFLKNSLVMFSFSVGVPSGAQRSGCRGGSRYVEGCWGLQCFWKILGPAPGREPFPLDNIYPRFASVVLQVIEY